MRTESRVKMRGSEKKSEQEHKQQIFFLSAHEIFSIKRVARKIHVATTTTKKCTTKVPIRSTELCFFPVAIYKYTILFLVSVN